VTAENCCLVAMVSHLARVGAADGNVGRWSQDRQTVAITPTSAIIGKAMKAIIRRPPIPLVVARMGLAGFVWASWCGTDRGG
jgi:hypothetical protein